MFFSAAQYTDLEHEIGLTRRRALEHAGLQCDPRGDAECMAATQAAAEIWRRTRSEVLSPELDAALEQMAGARASSGRLDACGPLFTFGHVVGRHLALACGGSANEVDRAGVLCGLAHVCAGLFDKAIDGDAGARHAVQRALGRKTIAAAIRSLDPNQPRHVLRDTGRGPIPIRVLRSLVAAFFLRARGALEDNDSATLVREIQSTLKAMYEAEQASISCTFDRAPTARGVRKVLIAAGSLPVWLLCLCALAPLHRRPALRSMKGPMLRLGLALQLADDLDDVVEDAQAGRWNLVWLHYATRHRQAWNDDSLSRRYPRALVRALIGCGAIDNVAESMCHELVTAFDALGAGDMDARSMREHYLRWIVA